MSDALGRSIRLKVSASALRTVEQRGGLDHYLLKASDADLSVHAQSVKKEIRQVLADRKTG